MTTTAIARSIPETTLVPLAIPREVTAQYPDTFRAAWPVTDHTVPVDELIAFAAAVPGAAALVGTDGVVLIYEAPGRPVPRRPYHHRSIR